MRQETDTPHSGTAYTAAANLLKDHLTQMQQRAVALVSERSWQDNRAAFEEACENLKLAFRLRLSLNCIISRGVVQKAPLYLTTATFLRRAFQTLTRTANENLVYVTGPEAGTTIFALTNIVEFNLAQRSPANAVPDPASQLEALERLDDTGQRLLATFHSHPGHGAGATRPSGVDLETQKQLEEAGYPAIGAIVSRDGYVRFYAAGRQFQVTVSGSGVEQISEHLFFLKDMHRERFFIRRGKWRKDIK